MKGKENPLAQLHQLGQSIWLDYIHRQMLTSGELKQLIEADDLMGMTSNPTIFAKAISESKDYDTYLKELSEKIQDNEELLIRLTQRDIQEACDHFKNVFQRTQGKDGFVSWEVNPHLANDTEGTKREVRRHGELTNRANVMIKIPATREGLPAIQAMIAEGRHINVTLIFSIQRYAEVVDAYFSGLEQRVKSGKDISQIQSVASIFVSRIDTKTDPLLEKKGLIPLQGKIAIANSKLLYEKFKELFSSERFKKLEAKGANLQRPLWGSTSTKNPAYRDVLYVEELIGPHTVNTIPHPTLKAFLDHGKVKSTLEAGITEAKQALADLAKGGISLEVITDQLEIEGVKAFQDSYDQLLSAVREKRKKL